MSKVFQYPFKVSPLGEDIQKRIARDFRAYPNGLVSANHWGFKLSGTTTEKELEDAYNHPLDPRDVWVVTPPKCGTTWMQEMVWLLANDLDYEGAKAPLFPDRWGFLDFFFIVDKQSLANMTGREASSEDKRAATKAHSPPPRFVKSHLPMSMNNPRLLDVCKVVYVARNPKDACVSFFHHHRLFRALDFTGDMKLFMEYFMSGNIAETPHIEHMIEAWNLRHHPNMCFIFFEDMKTDLKSQIRKVATFLGKSYRDEQVDRLATHLHFDNIKQNQSVNYDYLELSKLMYKDRGSFVRKGKTGDWKNHFSPEMTVKFDNWMAEKLRGTDLRFADDLDVQD